MQVWRGTPRVTLPRRDRAASRSKALRFGDVSLATGRHPVLGGPAVVPCLEALGGRPSSTGAPGASQNHLSDSIEPVTATRQQPACGSARLRPAAPSSRHTPHSVFGTASTEGRADRSTRASREVGGPPGGDLYPRKNSSHIRSEDPGVTPGRYFPYS